MKLDMVRPCDNCPFRSDIRPYLRRGRSAEIAASLLDHDQCFPCHKTVDYDHDDEPEHSPDQQHCAGAMIWLSHQQMPNQWMRIMRRLGMFDPGRLDMTAPVYSTRAAFVAAEER